MNDRPSKPPRPTPITDTDRQRVRELHAQGMGRNDICREIGRSAGAVTGIAQELGLSFDRRATEAATEARQADLADRRTRLASDLIDDAERLRAQMWQPCKVYSFGGRDNVYRDQDMSEPPPAEKRALMGAAGMAIDRSLKLVPVKDDADVEAARSMLSTLGQAIMQRVEQSDAEADGGES